MISKAGSDMYTANPIFHRRAEFDRKSLSGQNVEAVCSEENQIIEPCLIAVRKTHEYEWIINSNRDIFTYYTIAWFGIIQLCRQHYEREIVSKKVLLRVTPAT